MSQARVIKRYANRKLYDTQHSRYVTLDQISEMIREGDDVKIIDNKTKEDLTSVTLAQIIFEEEKKQRSFLPLQAMRNIIQNGGESLSQLLTEAQRRVTSILPRKKGDGEKGEHGEHDVTDAEIVDGPGDAAPAPAPAPASASASAPGPAGKKSGDGLASLREFREWVQQSQRTIDEWQRRVDDRIRHAIEGISPFSGLQKDVKALGSRIAELEAKLSRLAEGEREAPAGRPEVRDAAPPSGSVAASGSMAASGDEAEVVVAGGRDDANGSGSADGVSKPAPIDSH